MIKRKKVFLSPRQFLLPVEKPCEKQKVGLKGSLISNKFLDSIEKRTQYYSSLCSSGTPFTSSTNKLIPILERYHKKKQSAAHNVKPRNIKNFHLKNKSLYDTHEILVKSQKVIPIYKRSRL